MSSEPPGRQGPAAYRLADLSWPEAAERAAAGALLSVPVASTEQHGPHLPLSTDTDLAVELCRRLAAARADVVAAPALAYGASGEHEGFAGTLSIGTAALALVLLELCRSAGATFSGVVLVSTHGGNAEALGRAERTLAAEGRRVLVWSARWRGDAHAGRSETSLQLALAPERVRRERAVAGDRRPLATLLPELRSSSVRAVSPSGVLGDPTGASAEEGERLLATLAQDLVAAVARWWGNGDDQPAEGRR